MRTDEPDLSNKALKHTHTRAHNTHETRTQTHDTHQMYLTSAIKLKRPPEFCVVFDCDPEVLPLTLNP